MIYLPLPLTLSLTHVISSERTDGSACSAVHRTSNARTRAVEVSLNPITRLLSDIVPCHAMPCHACTAALNAATASASMLAFTY
jgi:hypothetical protein